MMRQFLALVAILTGLTTLAAPAQARLSVLDDVRVQVSGEAAAQCPLAHRQAIAAVRPASPLMRDAKPGPCARPGAAVIIPAVMLKADRARE